MKIIAILVALLATASSVSACGSTIPAQSFPSVPLSEFGVSSVLVAKKPPVVEYTYDYVCAKQETQIHYGVLPDQKFPSVPLSEFGVGSWKIAK